MQAYLDCIVAARQPAGSGGSATIYRHRYPTSSRDVRRIREQLSRHGDDASPRILSEAELATRRQRSALAERGRALPGDPLLGQGSFSKAVGLGMRMPMTWRD